MMITFIENLDFCMHNTNPRHFIGSNFKFISFNKKIIKRSFFTQMRKLIFILCINVLAIDIQRQSLILIFFLGFCQYYEMIKEPYIINNINKLASVSNIILILAIWLKIFSWAINYEMFEVLVGFVILFENTGYLIFIGWKIVRNQKQNIHKIFFNVYRSIKSSLYLINELTIILKLGNLSHKKLSKFTEIQNARVK